MTVTTTGATHDLACRANATFGVNVIEPSCDLRTSLGPGDWLRVGHNESHGRLRNEDAAGRKPWAGVAGPRAARREHARLHGRGRRPSRPTRSRSRARGPTRATPTWRSTSRATAKERGRLPLRRDVRHAAGRPAAARRDAAQHEKFRTEVTYCERYRYQEVRTRWRRASTTAPTAEAMQAADRDFQGGSNYVNGTFTLSSAGRRRGSCRRTLNRRRSKTRFEDKFLDAGRGLGRVDHGPFGPGRHPWLVRLRSRLSATLLRPNRRGLFISRPLSPPASRISGSTTHLPRGAASSSRRISRAWRGFEHGIANDFVARSTVVPPLDERKLRLARPLRRAATPPWARATWTSRPRSRASVGQYFNHRFVYAATRREALDQRVDFEFEVEDDHGRGPRGGAVDDVRRPSTRCLHVRLRRS